MAGSFVFAEVWAHARISAKLKYGRRQSRRLQRSRSERCACAQRCRVGNVSFAVTRSCAGVGYFGETESCVRCANRRGSARRPAAREAGSRYEAAATAAACRIRRSRMRRAAQVRWQRCLCGRRRLEKCERERQVESRRVSSIKATAS